MNSINAAIIAESFRYPLHLVKIERKDWPPAIKKLRHQECHEVWRSRKFMVQVYPEKNGIERLTMNRTVLKEDTINFEDGITWDELMELKRQCGRGDRWAVEMYPADAKIVNVANMRHLWCLPEGKTPDMGWL